MSSEEIARALRDPEHQERVKHWIQNARSIRILVTGKTGAGKSTLVNGIIGAEVAKPGNTLDPSTRKVEEFSADIGGVSVTVLDSPGLQDGTGQEKEYLADLERKCRNIDLVLYCTSMIETRVLESDVLAIAALAQAFGESFWKRAVFVLTFANNYQPPPRKKDQDGLYETKVKQWAEKLRDLVAEHVTLETAQNIPVLPAGHASTPSLPGTNSWLADLWFACLARTSPDARPALLKINWDRLKPAESVKEADVRDRNLPEQPIPVPPESPFVLIGRRILQNAVPLVREFLGLQARAMDVGSLGQQVGRYVGKGLGVLGEEFGGIAGAIVIQMIAEYVKTYLK